MSANIPVCRSSEDMARLDGQRVRLEGTYRKKLEQLSMPRPGRPAPPPEFRGFVVLELEGSPEVFDPSLSADQPTLVQLGQDARPAEEVERLLDQRVSVQGRLVLDPTSLLSEEELEMARPDGLPTLVEPGEVAPAP